MGNIRVQGGKIEAVKVFGPFGSVDLFEFLQDFRGIIQKQLTPVFLAISSQYCVW